MRLLRAGFLGVFLLITAGALFIGCAEAPPCETSLITLDETRLDAETYEEEAAETGAKVAELEEKLTAKKRDIELIKDKPAELGEKVHALKKGSGRE